MLKIDEPYDSSIFLPNVYIFIIILDLKNTAKSCLIIYCKKYFSKLISKISYFYSVNICKIIH